MHIRISRVTRNGRTHEYAQLVESYRRPSDGMPAHRVIATLGAPGDVAVENFRAALDAARAGKRVALVRQLASDVRPPKPTANLHFLDLAVLLELWREWGLDTMLADLMPQGESLLRPASVVAALVLQRCVDPGSKLYAARWLPRTALPELLGFAPDSFNNTRLHRVLDDLDSATRSLMARLPKRYEQRDGAFASLFMDVTDTWFIGDGPSLASRGKTKEGRVERKIGIVLLCNEHGLPLRWETISGAQADKPAMIDMLRAVSGMSWASTAPMVCDRAMGNAATIREMLATGLRFVTALTVTEFDSFTQSLPHQPFAALEPRDEKTDIAAAAQCAETAGLKRVRDDLFVLDLDVVEYAEPDPTAQNVDHDEAATVRAMRLGRLIDDDVNSGRFASFAAAGRVRGLTKRLSSKYASLRSLSEQQQRDVLDGKAAHCTLQGLLDVAAIEDADERQKGFDHLIATNVSLRASSPAPALKTAKTAHVEKQPPMRVRVVAYFNPERFVYERTAARRQLAQVDAFVAKLRANIAAAPGRYKVSSVSAAIDRELRKLAVLDAYTVSVSPSERGGAVDIHITLDAAEWARRRRYDGFTVLVAHPSLPHTAAELSALYRAKDAVEKDFYVIKSVVDLRPVWHHTDAKVRAHVTICMLALLLERTLRRRLQPLGKSAVAALEALAPCHLNHYAAAGLSAYCVTQLNQEQRSILKALRMLHLADDDDLAGKIRPREGVVTTPPAKEARKQAQS
jgi:hypothetical protein